MLNTIKREVVYRSLFCFSFVLVLICSNFLTEAQNICPNNSFENVSPCPSALSQLSNATPWNDPPGSNATSDLFNACHINSNPVTCQDVGIPQNFSGSATAHSGDGYAGIIVYYGSVLREYIQAPLDSSMLPGAAYNIEAWFRRSSLSHFATDKLGIMISTGAINQPGTANITAIPQFETAGVLINDASWTLLSGIYTAVGGEDHITIGNFRDNAGTTIVNMGLPVGNCAINTASAYYYIDDIKVERINEVVHILGDTLICPGDSVTLTANSNVSTWWSTAALPNDTFSIAGSIVVSPSATTTYILNGLLVKDVAVVHVVSPPVVNLGKDTTLCEGQSIVLDALNPGVMYLWSTGETDSVITADKNQLYWVLVDNGGCTDSDSLDLVILPNLPVDLGLDSVFCFSSSDILVLDAGPAKTFSWLPGGDTTQTVNVNSELSYTVTVTHPNGCTVSSSITTVEECPVTVFIPKSFTPNGDGRNELFLPIIKDNLSYDLKIFSRWGTLLFETANPEEGWDGNFRGSIAPAGNYVFQLKYGSVTDSQRIEKKTMRGSVLLVR